MHVPITNLGHHDCRVSPKLGPPTCTLVRGQEYSWESHYDTYMQLMHLALLSRSALSSELLPKYYLYCGETRASQLTTPSQIPLPTSPPQVPRYVLPRSLTTSSHSGTEQGLAVAKTPIYYTTPRTGLPFNLLLHIGYTHLATHNRQHVTDPRDITFFCT